jgi:predicted DNA-binding transcriptional regulator YafY
MCNEAAKKWHSYKLLFNIGKNRTMNTIEKLKAINNLLLQTAFIVNYDNVAEHLLEVYDLEKYSKRSFLRDIKGLKEVIGQRYPTLEDDLGPLIKYNRVKDRYTYVRDDLSAFPSLSEKELTQIASIIEFNQHLFTDRAGKGVVNKLRAISLENSLTEYNELISWPSIQLIKDGERSGSEKLQKLIECISGKKIIELQHKGLTSKSQTKTISGLPIMIKEYNNGWYTGWYLLFHEVNVTDKVIEPRIEGLRLLALDRIEFVKERTDNRRISIPVNFDPVEYFKYCFGIIRDNISNPNLKHEKVTIKLEPKNWILPYVIKYPLHFTQEVKVVNEETKEAIIELDIEINNELISLILKYTDYMTVISPVGLRVTVIERLQKSLSNYTV